MRLSWMALLMLLLTGPVGAEPTRWTIEPSGEGRWQLLRNGTELFVIKGAGGWERLDDLAAAGGNSVRTWGSERLDGATYDEAARLGLTVCAGLWMGYGDDGTDYNDPASIQADFERILRWVRRYKDHPAIMLWGVGNEAEVHGPAPQVFRATEALAAAIRAIDPHHPVITVVAGFDDEKIRLLKELCPSLDALGVNQYGPAVHTLGERLAQAGWDKPWLVTEFGPYGDWDAPRTEWNAAIDPTSTEKQDGYLEGYRRGIEPYLDGACLGSYAYQWGYQPIFAGSDTWYNLHARPHGDSLGGVDALQLAWTGRPPANRAPRIVSLNGPAQERPVPPGAEFVVELDAADPDGDVLTYAWEVRTDAVETGAPFSTPAEEADVAPTDGNRVTVRAPTREGMYRLYATVRDGKGKAAQANFPFHVTPGAEDH